MSGTRKTKRKVKTMSKNFLRIPVEGHPEIITVKEGQDELALLQKTVGGYIEAVTVTEDGHTLYLNDEGKMNGLPVNETATRMTRGILSPYDLIMGDTVLVGPVDDEGESTTVDIDTIGQRFALELGTPAGATR